MLRAGRLLLLGEARREDTKDETDTEKREKKNYKESHLGLLTLASPNKRVTHKVKDLRKTLENACGLVEKVK